MHNLILGTAAIGALVGCEGAMFTKEPAVRLADAVRAAEEHEGGSAVDADLDDDDLPLFYEVTVVRDGAATVVWVDADTGAVADSWADDVDAEDVGLLEKSKLTLLDAIQAAEDYKGGYATSADLDRIGAGAGYDVEVVRQLRSIDLQVDAVTGAVSKPLED